MKRILIYLPIIIVAFINCQLIKAQNPTTSENFIYVQEPLDGVTMVDNNVRAKRSIQYFDGLGRLKQTVLIKASPGSSNSYDRDLVLAVEYNGFGLQHREYLPIRSTFSDGSYYSNYINAGISQYNTEITYSEKEFELSPLGRVKKQGAPGEEWMLNSGHEIKFGYAFNASSDQVRKLSVRNNGALNWNNSGYYQPNLLYKTITIDENNNTIFEFKNKEGQVVLKRSFVVNYVLNTERPSAPDPGTNAQSRVDTYYVYDEFGNLVYVIPPLASAKSNLTQNDYDELIYQYKYDHKNRLIEKKLPGKGWEYMVYDKQNRLVATQDANQRALGFWMFTKYDKFGRVVYTGICDGGSREGVQNTLNNFTTSNNEIFNETGFTSNGLLIKYTNSAFPTTGIQEILTVNYYDRYSFNFTGSIANVKQSNLPNVSGLRNGNKLKGMPTDSYVKIIGEDQWEHNKAFYDDKSRSVVSLKNNHLGGYTESSVVYDFRGKATSSLLYHKRTDSPNEVEIYNRDVFTYDDQERAILHAKALNPNNIQSQLIYDNKYNFRGELNLKKVGGNNSNGTDNWQSITYKYNIRGWLTNINEIENPLNGEGKVPPATDDKLFAFKIVYNNFNPQNNPHAEKLYNGNIAQTFWKTGVDNIVRGYSYKYDELNRLITAVHHNPQQNNTYSGAFDEYITYDFNGNIKQLKRNTGDALGNSIAMDDLTYTYKAGAGNSNVLVKVSDNVSSTSVGGFVDGYTGTQNDYTYDANGNMIRDRNKGISEITYNHLNLPEYILFDGNKGSIAYLYNALGQKVQKTVVDNNAGTEGMITSVDYLDGFQYVGGVLQFYPHAEGYVRATQNKAQTNYQFDFVYNYTDHLGNIRLSYTKDPMTHELKILEENHYYPFGLKHAIYDTGGKKDYMFDDDMPQGAEELARPGFVYAIPYQYKYNGKEWQEELGLGWYDYHARNYDPALGRWNVIDPMAPKYFSHSPYAYALNNPVYFIDPDGMQVGPGDDIINEDDPIVLKTAVITAKAPEKKQSSGHYTAGFTFSFPSFNAKRAFFGNHVDGAYRNMLSPQNKEGYLKMQQAKREGEMFMIGVFAVVLAPEFAMYGSVMAETKFGLYLMQTLGKTGIDGTAQFLITGDVNWANAIAGSFIPGKAGNILSPLTSEASQSYQDNLDGNFDMTKSLLRTGANYMGNGLGNSAKLVGQENGFNAVQNFIFENGIQSFHNNLQGEVIKKEFNTSK